MFVSTDLHGHTYHSDGRATPEEYVEFRRSLQAPMAMVNKQAKVGREAQRLAPPVLEETRRTHDERRPDCARFA